MQKDQFSLHVVCACVHMHLHLTLGIGNSLRQMNCVICIGKCPGEQHVTLRQQTTSQDCGDHAGPPGVLLEDRRHHRQARSYNGTYNLPLSPTILPKQIQTIINNVQRFNLSK